MISKALYFLTSVTILLTGLPFDAIADERPNILWITIEDWSPDLSCYGTKGIHTPNVDKLAAEGIRYERAFTTSPVCSTSRSAMMTGFHQNYIGAHQHRTDDKQPLPFGIRPIPHLFADAGYFTCLMSWKTDCNFLPDKKNELFMDLKDWKNRDPDQPFFARITFGGTHRKWARDPQRPIDIKDVELPPYYPDTPFIRRDWANGLEQMQLVDREVGAILKRLDDEGLTDNTIVFFIGDHGRCHIRGKQFLYDEGTRIPMIMRWPGKVQPGQVNDDMVMSIDICATILEAASITPPVRLHGRSLFNEDIKRKYTFAARDKMDTTHDAMRSIRSKEHKLILNLMPQRAYCQFSFYKEGAYPPLAELNVLNLEGKLTPEQAAFMSPTKPPIELFDLRTDPHEVHNVADDPKYAEVKSELLAELKYWRKNVIRDQGVSDAFRAENIFPSERPAEQTVGQWAVDHAGEFNFQKNGVPRWYPTRTLQQWRDVRKIWEPWVFREPNSKMERPIIPFTKKPKTGKK